MLFCCCSADNEVKAQTTMDKMYITIGGQTQSVTLVDNDATRELVAALQSAPLTIRSLSPNPSPKGEGNYYSLNGVKVSNPSKGIYIQNVNKVVIK